MKLEPLVHIAKTKKENEVAVKCTTTDIGVLVSCCEHRLLVGERGVSSRQISFLFAICWSDGVVTVDL